MEEIIPLLILLFIAGPVVAALGNAKNKQQQQQQQKQRQQRPARQAPAKPAAPASVLPPRSETRLRPTLAPTLHDHSGMFEGSLHADGTEGVDPHDHGFDHEVDMPSDHSEEALNASLTAEGARPAAAPGLRLDFSPKNIASAFVLQEVLKRR